VVSITNNLLHFSAECKELLNEGVDDSQDKYTPCKVGGFIIFLSAIFQYHNSVIRKVGYQRCK
jgi:hypothetical protein